MYGMTIQGSERDPEEREATPAEQEIAVKVLDHLRREFPDYPFTCCPDLRATGGIVQIRCPILPGQWGVNLHVKTLNSVGGYKVLRDMVGEMFERFNLSRARYNPTVAPLARPQL